MLTSGGEFSIFFTRPMSGTLFALMALVIIISTVAGIRRRRQRSRPATPGEEDLAASGMTAEPEGTPGAENTDATATDGAASQSDSGVGRDRS